MADDGETKDDVKVPDGEVGEKIEKLFKLEEKDTSTLHPAISSEYNTDMHRHHCPHLHGRRGCH